MSISQSTNAGNLFTAVEDAAWRAASRANPSLTFDQFHTLWQTGASSNPAGSVTGGPISQASGFTPQPGADTPGTGTYGQTGGAYNFGSLLQPNVPVAPAPAGSTPAVGLDPPGPEGRSGGDSGPGGVPGSGGGLGGLSGGSSGKGNGIGGSGISLGGVAGAIGGAFGGPVGAAIGRGLGVAANALSEAVDPPTPENSTMGNSNVSAADMSRETSKEAAASQAEANSGNPNGATGSETQGSEGGRNSGGAGSNTGGPGTGANGSGGHGTDAGSNDASDGPGGNGGTWAAGGFLAPAKGGHRSGEVSGRGFTKVGNGIRAYGMGFAGGGFATANTHGVGAGRSIPHGLIPGISPGRADAVHASVKKGSYIMPADVVSSIGGGNSANGGHKLNQWVGGAGFQSGAGMPGTGYARGGLVDVRLSSGEYHVPPEFVHWLGKGDPDKGAKILDGHVARIRAKQITHLRNLPPPK